ncbi:MAG TPA: response regulator [Myxococcota bacterium]|nr:response regulator [Myxococcota bacterium]
MRCAPAVDFPQFPALSRCFPRLFWYLTEGCDDIFRCNVAENDTRRARQATVQPVRLKHVLLVDDREMTRDLLMGYLERADFVVQEAPNGEAAWALFQQQPFDLIVTNLQMPGIDGISLIRRIRSARSREPRTPILLLSALGSLSAAAAAGRAGVTDCFALDNEGISTMVVRARELVSIDDPPIPSALLGSSPSIVAARERILCIAELNTPVLITGEKGLGHGEVAAYLYALGRLAGRRFHRITSSSNLGTSSRDGAVMWYLEEVSDFSPEAQVAWYQRILESRLGSEAHRTRFIASSSEDLRILANQQRFASDFARELCQFEVWLPPLRERRDDFPELIYSTLKTVGERIGRPGVGIAAKAIDHLSACAWWENFVELETVLESLAAFAPGLEITAQQAELVFLDSDPKARAARERARCERAQLLTLFGECRGNYTRMAERLNVDRGTIRYRLRKYGILPSSVAPSNT